MTASPIRFCDECGAANAVQASLCYACSTPLASSAPSSSTPSRQISLMTFASPSPTALPIEPGPGSILKQRYRLVREIGQGGFGVVYLARDEKTRGRRVAVKQINISKLGVRESIDATDSYNREVALLSKLKHARLPRLYDHFTDPQHWYLVMDYIDGQTLEALMQPGRSLSVKKTVNIGIQLCEVLQYLHVQTPPIIFRDVKPSNVMFTRRGRAYLIDFGIARRFQSGRARDTGSLGSPGYAAPEQYGKNQTTAQTDIYGLGATLQTLVTGKEPLDVNAGDLSGGSWQLRKLQLLLDRMLERDSSKRPQSMQEVKAILKNIRYGRKKFVFSPIFGFFLTLAPYAIFASLVSLTYLYNYSNFLIPFIWVLLIAIYCTWPFLVIGQLVTAIMFLLKPYKRLLGLGMLAGLLVFALALSRWAGPLSFLLSWPAFGG